MAKYWEEFGRERGESTTLSSGEGGQGGVEIGMCEQIRWGEVVDILKCLKRGKAPGPDGVLNEIMMFGGERIIEVFVDLLNIVLKSECCPEDWMRSLVIPLYKDSNTEVIGNYQGISLGCFVATGFTRLLAWRLGKFLRSKDRFQELEEVLFVLGGCERFGKGRGGILIYFF